MRALLVPLTIGIALLGATTGLASGTPQTLTGVVGPSFNISLKAHAKAVKTLAPGRYIFVIHDNSSIHNFHLTGPGVNKKTTVGGTGKTTWHLTLRSGTYKFVCDPHASVMKGKFVVRAP